MSSVLEVLGFISVILLCVGAVCFGVFVYLNTLEQFKWYRRWRGGRWECWYVDPCKSMIWHEIKKGEQGYPNRPPCCFGTPIIEEYPYRDDV